jgi:hypothetical protein
MANPNPQVSTVRRSLISRSSVATSLSTLTNVCTTGAQCPQVQASPIALQALGILQKSVSAAGVALTSKQAAAAALATARKSLQVDFKAVRIALTTYETAVTSIAGGSAAIITSAGLLARDQKVPAATLTAVSVVHAKPGKHATEAIISWPRAPGATGYALEASFAPQAATPTWVTLASGTGRRRVVKGPAAGAQFLVRVASLGSDGTQSDWSNPVMATAL